MSLPETIKELRLDSYIEIISNFLSGEELKEEIQNYKNGNPNY